MVTSNTVSAVGWHQLGMAVLAESYRWAAFGMLGATTMAYHVERIEGAKTFLFKGTGLEVALDLFGIALTGEDARDIFQGWVKRQTTPYRPTDWQAHHFLDA